MENQYRKKMRYINNRNIAALQYTATTPTRHQQQHHHGKTMQQRYVSSRKQREVQGTFRHIPISIE